MAQTGFTPISLYYTATAAATPTAGNLVAGELAINTNDGKLFYKDSAGVVQTIASKNSNSGTFTNISVSSVATFGAGTVSAPAITTTGDTNTGIYFPAADTIAFTEGGVESMRIDSSGNLGVGVTTVQASASGKTIQASGCLIAGGNLASHQTSRGVLQCDGEITTIRAYGATSGTGQIAFNTGGGGGSADAERMRIDSSGNVGIGTSSPTAPLTVVNSVVGEVFRLTSAAANIYGLASDGTISTYTGGVLTGIGGFVGTLSAHPYIFRTNNTERMRIDSNGKLLVGATTSGTNAYINTVATSTFDGIRVTADSTSTRTIASFSNPNGSVGTIQTSGSNTSYNTSSDYRLKENIAPMTGALATVQQLKPVTYNWKVDGSSSQGFIAHELAEVCPEAVVGEKDAVETIDDVDADGKVIGKKEVPKYQGIDTSFLVATLTAAIQELKAELDSVKAELQTLKGN